MDKNERRICWYASVLIALMINAPKLLALRENGLMARVWRFNLGELLFQEAFSLLFCCLFFYLNLQKGRGLSVYLERKRYDTHILFNALFLVVSVIIGGTIQRLAFHNPQYRGVYWGGYLTRLGLGCFLAGIMVKIIRLIRQAKQKEQENEQLKIANMAAELELLKGQMNPHFLFNALSSLSGVVREDPALAQHYIKELANFFRYVLGTTGADMVTVSDELAMLHSFAQLLKMRMENTFQLRVDIDDAFLHYRLPHLSLQPLLENAGKHNSATLAKPLVVDLNIHNGMLVMSNSLNEIPTPESSNGMGLVNLNERFKILTGHGIDITKSANEFIVKLPLTA